MFNLLFINKLYCNRNREKHNRNKRRERGSTVEDGTYTYRGIYSCLTKTVEPENPIPHGAETRHRSHERARTQGM